MMAPEWDPVDDATADLLTLVADEHHVSADHEWRTFTDAVVRVAHSHGGRVDQNDVRPLIRGRIAPKRIGAFWRRACLEGLLVVDGWSVSDDREGRNAGRPMRCYALTT
jgi:hypothetical protein